MATAWTCAFLGLVVTWAVGHLHLGIEIPELVRAILATDLAGLLALMTILRGQAVPALRRHVIKGTVSTWTLFLTVYFGVMLLLAPVLRTWDVFPALLFPLVLTNGFSILVFGPIQDRWVASAQRRSKGL